MPDVKAEGFVQGTRKIVQILRYGPRELALAVLGFLLLGATALLPKLVELLPLLKPALPWLAGVLVVLGILLLAFSVWRIWKKAVAPLPEAKPKPAAIKGPAPFGPQDAELFARLGRNEDLDRLRSWLLDDQKPLIALMGESGVGKTSLLRAGLAHHLKEDNVPVIYWEAVPTDPEAKLLHAIRMRWEDPEKAPKTFEELTAAVASSSRVVVIDQAEQLSPDGHPRIFELLRQVALADPPFPATWVVAFRREHLPVWRDFELSLPEMVQRRLETLSLQRFSPKAAERVIAVLAEEGSLPVDQKVVQELVEGVTVEGKVSPADIGISLLVLSELAGGNPDASLSLDDYRASGGQAGLLTRYLERLLEQLPEAERRELLHALLSLVDLEKDQRLAEGRTLEELKDSAKPANPPRFEAALRFLASGKARVLEELLADLLRYRLVHERLIPAIRRLTGILLAEADQARLLLERSYQIWDRDRKRQYLLSGQELAQVQRLYKQITWTTRKQEFLNLSLRQQRFRLGIVGVALLIVLGLGYAGLVHVEEEKEIESLRARLEEWGLPQDLYDYVEQLDELSLPGTVTRLDWLSNAKRLRILRVAGRKIQSYEGLPVGIRQLEVGKPGDLEENTEEKFERADFRYDPTLLDTLPSSLNSLAVHSGIVIPQKFPKDLQVLTLPVVRYFGQGMLPGSLKTLSLYSEELSGLAYLGNMKSISSLTITLNSDDIDNFVGVLPEGLQSLTLRGAKIHSLNGLPRRLESLALERVQVPSLRGLPGSLRSLDIGKASVESVDNLPPGLRFLGISMNVDDLSRLDLKQLVALDLWADGGGTPRTLDLQALRSSILRLKLRIVDRRASIINIPQGVRSLSIAGMRGGEYSIEDLPRSLEHLDLRGEGTFRLNLKKLPPHLGVLGLIGTIEDLSHGYNAQKLKLPSSLVVLRLGPPNKARHIEFPLSLRILDLEGVYMAGVPPSLAQLIRLSAREANMNTLPVFLKNLKYLDISGNSVSSLRGLPDGLQSLTLSTDQLTSLVGLPRGVRALHFRGD